MINFTRPPLGTPLNPAHRLNQGLVLYMPFGEGAGSKTQDLSGKGNHGTLTNMVQGATSGFTGGKFGGAMNFDGTNDYVDCGGASNLNIPNDLTISLWIKFNSVTGTKVFVGNANSAGSALNYSFEVGRTTNKITWVNTGAAVNFTSTRNVAIDIWYHIVTTRSGTISPWILKLYIDGAADVSVTTTTQSTTAGKTSIGRSGDNDGLYLNGSISEVRIYNRALSAQEVQQLYTDPFCMYESKSLSRWAQLIKKGSFFFAKRF